MSLFLEFEWRFIRLFRPLSSYLICFYRQSHLNVAKMRILPLPVCPSVRIYLENGWTNFRDILYRRVLLRFVYIFEFWLQLVKNNERFTRRPTCISTRRSDKVENLQAILVTMVTWRNPAGNPVRKSLVKTSAHSPIGVRHPAQSTVVAPPPPQTTLTSLETFTKVKMKLWRTRLNCYAMRTLPDLFSFYQSVSACLAYQSVSILRYRYLSI
jgi:hypothetical protein